MGSFKDPKIADRAKDALIVVTCALGGQAKLGAKILVDYGFTNVKVVEVCCWLTAGYPAASDSLLTRSRCCAMLAPGWLHRLQERVPVSVNKQVCAEVSR